MRWRIAVARSLAADGIDAIGLAADPRYPDWPCAQAKVPEISLRRGVGRARRSTTPEQMEGRRQGQRHW